MLVIFGILVISTQVSTGLLSMNPVCRFTQSDPCYGAVGRPLYLQLPSEDQLVLKMSNSGTFSILILKFKNQRATKHHSDYPRWEFVTDKRTMVISSAEKRDSGKYKLESFDSFGRSKGMYFLQLIIEAVVSSVTVTDSCSSKDKRDVYCSSDGDNVHYNWTFLHTHQLADGNQTLLLDKEAHGSVTCYAQNHVSHGKKTIELRQCSETSHIMSTMDMGCGQMTFLDTSFLVFVSVWLFEVIVLLSLLVGAFYIYTRIYKKLRAAEGKEQEVEEVL
ncbi:hypothetical protein SRHO_G00191980 [Serrasalmus rhombeus]